MTNLILSVAAFNLAKEPDTKPISRPAPVIRQPVQEPSRGGEAELFEATAYCYGTVTKTGTAPIEGRTVAVDPSIIPLGSRLIINGRSGYIAEDTGKDIVGRRVDIYISDRDRCLQFGRQLVRLEVEK